MAANEEMNELRVRLCPLAEDVASGFDVTLDYSEASVEHVERILGEVHNNYLTTHSEEGMRGIALEFGAYLVTVLERHYGPVVWKRDHPTIGGETFPVYWRGTTLFPYGWGLKRIFDGPGDEICSKWEACVVQRAKPQS
jgi:hypothetical protein